MTNIPNDDSNICPEERENFNHPAFHSLLPDPSTARTWRPKKPVAKVHKAVQFMMDTETNANIFQNRVEASRAKEYLIPYLEYLEGVLIQSNMFDEETIESFVECQPLKQVPPCRNGQTTGVRRSMKEIRLNLERNGYKQSMDVIKDVCHWVRAMKLHYRVTDVFGFMARMVDMAIQKAESSIECKRQYKVCCFLDRYSTPPMTRCDGLCDYLLEAGNVIYAIIAKDIDYNLCYKCYRRSPETISFDLPIRNNSTKTTLVELPKSCLVRKKIPMVVEPVEEETVECFLCFTLHHKMCVLYDEFNWEAGYTTSSKNFEGNFNASYCCHSCVQQLSSSPLAYQIYTAKTMQTTSVAKYIESELQYFLFELCKTSTSPALPPVIQVRELSSRKIFFKATGHMEVDFNKYGKAVEFSFRSRSLMLTQRCEIDGRLESEKALFNVIIHEYDNGWILISYLDSVRLFQPAQLRRRLYQRVLLSYMRYLQQYRTNQFQHIYVWACPPKPGEEYVFLGRPASQVALDGTGLRIWYETIFEQAKSDNLIQDYLVINEDNNPFPTYVDIPYFHDDFWPDKLEQIQTEYYKAIEEYKESIDEDRNSTGDLRAKRRKKRAPPPIPLTIQQRVDGIFKKDLNNSVFIVNLSQANCMGQQVPVQKDPDIWNKFMCRRENYQLSCRQRRIDFSDERRATYATLHMHSRMAEESLQITCWYCEVKISEGYYCYKCDTAVFCKHCLHVHARFEEEHGRDCMLPFKAPFVKPTEWDDTFGKILQVVDLDAKFITKFVFEATVPYYRRDPSLRTFVRKVIDHMEAFGKEDTHDGTRCRICDCIWLTKIRHRRICLGSLCYVPSHSRNLLFEEDGTRLDKNDMWNRHFLEFSTQVSEQEIEEAQQQELMYSPPRPFPLPNEAEHEEEEVEALNEEEPYQSDDEAIIPIQQIPEVEPVALENEELNTSPPRVAEECEENYIVGDDNDDIEPRDPLAPDE